MIYKMKNEISTDPLSTLPPNSHLDYLPHPSGDADKLTFRAIFNDHRFAFYFWNACTLEKRKNKNEYLADLITFDYHNDLFAPNEMDIKELEELNLVDDFDVSFFCWARLNGNSDNHILSAAYLNLIGNIYALTFQEIEEKEFTYVDKYKNVHNIFVSQDITELVKKVKESKLEIIFLDIDLDFFMRNLMSCEKETWELMSDKDFNKYMDTELLNTIRPRIDCMTIALEPEYTGSFYNSVTNFLRIEKKMFNSKNEWLI